MTYLCSILFICVASIDPLSKNKSPIIIKKCRNFCKQLTLPGRTVQQLPFFKTVRLCTVFNIELIDCPQVLMFLQLYEAIRILEFLSLFSNIGFCLFVVDCASLKKSVIHIQRHFVLVHKRSSELEVD